MVAHIARGFVALILVGAFVASMVESCCGRIGLASKLTDMRKVDIDSFTHPAFLTLFDSLPFGRTLDVKTGTRIMEVR